ncbi:hypothetical protein EON65_27045 [archaeon]|nr:MAG: hypothetical protein EON65_27045 [archaeon]
MYAFPAAIQALKFSKDSEGEKSLSLVEPLLMLSQAVLGKEILFMYIYLYPSHICVYPYMLSHTHRYESAVQGRGVFVLGTLDRSESPALLGRHPVQTVHA